MNAVAEPERNNARLGFWLLTVGAVAALGYATRLTTQGANASQDRNVLYHWSTAVGGVFQFGIFLALAWIGGRPRVHTAIVAVSSIMLGIATAQWALWQWVA